MPNPEIERLKRLIFVYGDKGGVGKSALARLLLDIYRQLAIPCKAIDDDTSNANLYRCYKRVGSGMQTLPDDEPDAVERVDFTVRGEADYLIDSLGDYSELILVDLQALSRDAFTTFIQELDLLLVADESGYRVTIVHVLGKTRSSVSALKEVVELCGDNADYVVVKNLLYLAMSHIPEVGFGTPKREYCKRYSGFHLSAIRRKSSPIWHCHDDTVLHPNANRYNSLITGDL